MKRKASFFRKTADKETAVNVEIIYARMEDGRILEIRHTGNALEISTEKPAHLAFEEVEKTTTRVRVL